MSLHVHSEFSSLDGWSTCDEIADRMEEIGCPYCGLTDHGVVAGHIEFDKAMRKRDLKPVFGCELYHGVDFDTIKAGERDQAHLLALAMTDEGLKNLWRLVNATADRSKFHHVGRVSCDDLVMYQKGIHFTSACPLGHVPKGLLKGDHSMLNWYLDNLENFSLEVTTYPGDAEWKDRDSEGDEVITPQLINELVVDAAAEHGVPVTYGDDGHYAFPDQYQWHDAYLAAQTRDSIYTPVEDRKMWHPEGALCIKDELTVREALAYLGEKVDEIIANTNEIGERADAHLPDTDRAHLPVFVPKQCPWVPEEHQGKDANELFKELVVDGIVERYADDPRIEEAWARAEHEVNVLIEDGLEHYFLMTWDIVKFCEKNDITIGPGRGSSAGSIVAYALGITDVDPLHYDLFFERFWNKGRAKGFPDIDSDFPRSKRPVIREYLIERWGEKQVCSIGTTKRFKPISVMNKFAQPCEISHGGATDSADLKEVKQIIEKIHEFKIHGPDQIGWNEEIEPGKVFYVNEKVGEEIQRWIGDDEKRERFIQICEHANSRNENYGIHPSGIVVSDIDLADYAPAYLRGKNPKAEGIPATQFPMDIIESLRLVKEDILGLKTLDTLAEWEKMLAAKGFEMDWSGRDREEQDESLWDLLEEGFVSGVFQVETKEGKELCERLKPRSIEDLGVLVALNRPGPDREEYIARKNGTSPVTYAHPMLEDILDSTYGLFVYQEQIIRFMWALGYSLSDADAMRKILGKKTPEKLVDIWMGSDEWKGKGFLDTALEKGFNEEQAREVWDTIEDFASYSFNKSHAIAYAIVAFRCLYAKWLAPAEFYIACIRTVEHSKRAELTPQYIKEARRMGIKVLPPDIRHSMAECDVYNDDIYFGFSDIKGVASAGPYLVYLRDELKFDLSTPESLQEQLEGYNKEQLKIKAKLLEKEELPAGWKSPKMLLSAKKIELVALAGGWDSILDEPVRLSHKQAAELEFLNVILTDDTEEVIAANREVIDACDTYAEALQPWSEKIVDLLDENGDAPDSIDYRLPGIITNVRPTRVKSSGASMGIVTIEYGRDELTFACFSNRWGKAKAIFQPHHVGIFTIRHAPPNERRKSESWHFETGHLLHE